MVEKVSKFMVSWVLSVECCFVLCVVGRHRERARREGKRTERGQSEGVDVEGDACEEWKDRRR